MQAEEETEAYYNGCSLRINEHDDFYINHRSDSIMADKTLADINKVFALGKYHYWDEYEDDNVKRFHFFEDNKGNDLHIDFSPYYKPTDGELEAVRKFVEITGRVPNRWDDNLGHNFFEGDALRILENLCPCGNPVCDEQYAHTTSGY